MRSIIRLAGALVSLSMIGSVAGGTAGQAVADLLGTARAGDRPAADTVVWLDTPNAPARPATGRVVLDQRNLSVSPHVLVVRVGTTIDFPSVDSPYFARADRSGAFTIAAGPGGGYTYHAWRPGATNELTGAWASTDGSLLVASP